MIDEEATVQREALWPDDLAPKRRAVQEGTATRVQLAAPDVLDARRSQRVARETAERARATNGKRIADRITPLQRHLLLDVVLCAAFAASWAAAESRPQPSSQAPTVMDLASTPARVAPSPPPAVAHPSVHEPRAPATDDAGATPEPQPEPQPATAATPASAAEALSRNDYEAALTQYRALASAQPQATVYGLIAGVLARKLSRPCPEGTPCASP